MWISKDLIEGIAPNIAKNSSCCSLQEIELLTLLSEYSPIEFPIAL